MRSRVIFVRSPFFEFPAVCGVVYKTKLQNAITLYRVNILKNFKNQLSSSIYALYKLYQRRIRPTLCYACFTGASVLRKREIANNSRSRQGTDLRLENKMCAMKFYTRYSVT